MKVLVVEDDPHIGRMVEIKLGNNGFAVLRAADGEQGLDLIRSERPDLILLDVNMPVMDGMEVLRQVRSDPELSQVPVILMTARGEESAERQGIEMGANDYVTKPFSPRDLLARVRRLLGIHAWER